MTSEVGFVVKVFGFKNKEKLQKCLLNFCVAFHSNFLPNLFSILSIFCPSLTLYLCFSLSFSLSFCLFLSNTLSLFFAFCQSMCLYVCLIVYRSVCFLSLFLSLFLFTVFTCHENIIKKQIQNFFIVKNTKSIFVTFVQTTFFQMTFDRMTFSSNDVCPNDVSSMTLNQRMNRHVLSCR